MDDNQAREILRKLDIEIANHWMIFLDDEQIGVKREIFRDIINDPDFQFHIILGGPGTGKTQVLLNLAESLVEKGIPVRFEVSDEMRVFLANAGIEVPKSPPVRETGEVVIIDDPNGAGPVEHHLLELTPDLRPRALVIAFDPFQLETIEEVVKMETLAHKISKTSAKIISSESSSLSWALAEIFAKYKFDVEPKTHFLTKRYRQPETPGVNNSVLTELIATNLDMGWFDVEAEFEPNIRNLLTKTVSISDFPSEGGSFEFVGFDAGTLQQQIDAALNREDRWTFTSSVLVVTDFEPATEFSQKLSELGLPIETETDSIQDKISRINFGDCKVVNFDESRKIRGMEFQDVFIFLKQSRAEALLKRGSNKRGFIWDDMMPLHTFISRSTQNVTIIVPYEVLPSQNIK